MKKYLMIALLLCSSATLADESILKSEHSSQPEIQTLLKSQQNTQSKCASSKIVAELDVNKQLEKSGCCSWHGGVCGCSNGRAVCCDGQYSPSCGC